VIVCQNNQWAISVPFSKQTASDGIAIKAVAYGMPGVRVDGNDVLAVVRAVREAHARARKGDGPSLVELVTYRRGGHSSSDDPTRYRKETDAPPWLRADPIERFEAWLAKNRRLDAARKDAMLASIRGRIDAALKIAEAAPQPPVASLFDDVCEKPPATLESQRAQVLGQEVGAAEGEFPL
jgi:TPP-dependent pyruvate/acetoin dehydrogenase alpha subunit